MRCRAIHATCVSSVEGAVKVASANERGGRAHAACQRCVLHTLIRATDAHGTKSQSPASRQVQVEDRVRTGLWVGDCFVFNNASWRLNYIVGGEVTVMFHLDRPMYLLGYIAAQQRVYLLDKQYAVVSYTLLLSLVEFKTLVMRDEMDEAYGMLDQIPEDHLDGCAALQ